MNNKTKFKLYISHEQNIPQSSQVGCVKNSEFSCDIVLSNQWLNERNMREICVTQNSHDNQFMIVINDTMLSKLQSGKKEHSFVIYHELGHIINGDFSKEKVAQASKARIQALEQGKVVQVELDADRFAVKYVGKDAAIKALKELLATRMHYDLINGNLGSKKNGLALKEYNLRIEAIQKI